MAFKMITGETFENEVVKSKKPCSRRIFCSLVQILCKIETRSG